MDPTARNMTSSQWKQAYAAYRKARERVSGGNSKESKSNNRRRSQKKPIAPGVHLPSSVSESGMLRQKVRADSAYADLRLTVDILAWVAVAISVLTALIALYYYISVPAAVISLLEASGRIVAILVVRLLMQVLIDIPDIALFRSLQQPSASPPPALNTESEAPIIE